MKECGMRDEERRGEPGGGPSYPERGSGRTSAGSRKEEQAQRNANGRVGLDMQRKKYLRRAHRGILRESQGRTLLLSISEKKRG
jgi:hypothetical protein